MSSEQPRISDSFLDRHRFKGYQCKSDISFFKVRVTAGPFRKKYNTRTQEHNNTRTQEHMNIITQEDKNTRTQEHNNTRRQEQNNTRTQEHKNKITQEQD